MTHLHNITDTDKRFSIDPITRAVTNNSGKVTLAQYDNNSERFVFELPRVIEGHDMSLCDNVEIHYINFASTTEKYEGVYLVDDLTVDEWEEDKASFSWLISEDATKYAGKLNFLVRFVCMDDEIPTYVWSTAIFKGITIVEGM